MPLHPRGGVDAAYNRHIDGSGLSTRLNGSLVSNGNVQSFQISPDSSRVVYRATQDNEFREELYSRPIDGTGMAVKLNNGGVPAGGDVIFFLISSDSSRVVFRGDLAERSPRGRR